MNDLSSDYARFALLLFFAATFSCLYATRILMGWLRARAILDKPNHRSSHARPTPRGGGLAVMAVASTLMAVVAWAAPSAWLALLVGGGLVLMALGWLDDRKGLSARLRLVVQAATVAALLLALPASERLIDVLPLWLERGLIALGWVWFINLYNFMDGIDGITGVETMALGGALGLVAGLGYLDPAYGWAGMILAGAALGFLRWNWHPAHIFLGDGGSLPLGFILGGLLLALALAGHWAAALILPLYYLMDATATLARRISRGHKPWEAHREHAYQKAARKFGRHDAVSLRIGVANGGLAGLALGALVWPDGSWIVMVAAVAWTSLWLWRLARADHP